MEKLKKSIIYLVTVILVCIDQIIKVFIINNLRDNPITIIKGILRFTYCENRGVAFSLGNGNVMFFIIINLLIIFGLIFYFEKNRNEFNIFSKIFFTMVIAGGISNLIDRIVRGFVVDFIDINEMIRFAIFNVADMYIVVGIFGLIISWLFKVYQEKEKV